MTMPPCRDGTGRMPEIPKPMGRPPDTTKMFSMFKYIPLTFQAYSKYFDYIEN
jgi:hypothetical protein